MKRKALSRLVGLLLAAISLTPMSPGAAPDPASLDASAIPKELPGIPGLQPKIEEVRKVVAYRVLAFDDLPPQKGVVVECDRLEALRGRCIEEVVFAPLPSAEDSRAEKARWKSMSTQVFHLWERLAYRWTRKDDPLTQTLLADGVTDLPSPADTWEGYKTGKRKTGTFTVSLPDSKNWYFEKDWIPKEYARGSESSPADLACPTRKKSLFEGLCLRLGPGDRVAPMVRIKGRFALRLGYAGKAHDFDLMAGNSQDSAPFFEQVYPFARGLAENDLRPLPLFERDWTGRRVTPADLEVDPELRGLFFLDQENPASTDEEPLPSTGYAQAVLKSKAAFRDFWDLVSLQIAQHGMEDYTVNHIRVLTALVAMKRPPGDARGRGASEYLVAASEGQTDSDEESARRLDSLFQASAESLDLRIESLPDSVLGEWVFALQKRDPQARIRAEDIQDFTSALREGRPDEGDSEQTGKIVSMIKGSARSPETFENIAELETWARNSAAEGIKHELLVRRGLVLFLGSQLERLGKAERREEDAESGEPRSSLAAIETRLLLSHFVHEARSTMDETEGSRATPKAVVDKVTKQWVKVLQTHGFAPQPISQGLGAIDPVAVCTTRYRSEALEEPSFGAINLDILLKAEDRQGIKTEEILWANRAEIPFLMLDSPEVTEPHHQRLVGLPGEMALYRVRWRIWTGWHLFWSTAGAGTDPYRLTLRTAAVCDDMILSPPSLVPTLLRATLLEGAFRGTEPVRGDEAREEKRLLERERYEAERVNLSREEGGEGEASVERARKRTASPDGATLDYLRKAMLAPLRTLAEQQGGLLLVAVDASEPSRREAVAALRPRLPYARDARRGGREGQIRTAAWARYLGPKQEQLTPDLLSPAFRTPESVKSETHTPSPRWKRDSTFNFTFGAGLAASPYQHAHFTCHDLAGTAHELAPCADSDVPSDVWGEGGALDLQALTTLWVLDRPRIAVEAGLDARVDMNHSGTPWLREVAGNPDLVTAWRPAGGFIAGLRTAPRPHSLWRRGERASWGMDRLDGTSRLGRREMGLRGGFLLGPGFNGTEGLVLGELWTQWSLRSSHARAAFFTPYDPRLTLGCFTQVLYGFTAISNDEMLRYELGDTLTLLLGVKGQWDVQLSLPELGKK